MRSGTYALKRYTSHDAQDDYHAEVAAFKGLQQRQSGRHSNILAYYGCFEQKDNYNLMLEWADGGNLDEYMRRAAPPRTSHDIMILWNNILGLVRALKTIHDSSEQAKCRHERKEQAEFCYGYVPCFSSTYEWLI